MTNKENQAKKEYPKNHCKKLKTYKDKPLLKKAKRGKEKGYYYNKKRNMCRSMSKIKIKKNLQTI